MEKDIMVKKSLGDEQLSLASLDCCRRDRGGFKFGGRPLLLVEVPGRKLG
jgi:hypothetical protein